MNKERPIIFNAQMVRAILADKKTQTRRVIKPQPYFDNHCGGHWFWSGTNQWNSVHIGCSTIEKFQSAMLQTIGCVDWPYPRCPYGKPGGFCLDDIGEWQRGMPPCDGWYYVKDFSEDRPVWLIRFLPSDYPGEDVEPGLLWSESQYGGPEAIEVEGLSLQTIEWQKPEHYPGDRLWTRETWATEDRWDKLSPRIIPQHAHIWWRADYQSVCATGKWRPSIFMPRWASRITLEIVDVRVERVQDITLEDCVAEGIEEAVIMMVYPPTPERLREAAETIARDRFRELWDSINAKKGFGWDANPWCWCISFRRIER